MLLIELHRSCPRITSGFNRRKRKAHIKINSVGVTQQFQDKVCNTLLWVTPMGFMKIFIPHVPQLHWGLFTENSCGVAHSENGASLCLNDIDF